MTEQIPGQEPTQNTQPQGGQAPQNPPSNPVEPETFSREYVEELRRENAKYRTERNEAQTKLSDIETRQLAEQGKYKELAEKRERELEDIKLRRREDAISAAVRLAAMQAGFGDPNDAYTLGDLSKVAVDEQGNVTGATEAVSALAQSKPYLVKAGGPTPAPRLDGGAGGQTRPERTVVLTDEQKRLAQYAGMTEEQYIKYLTMPSVRATPDAGGEQ